LFKILFTCDSGGQHHGKERDEKIGMLPEGHIGLTAGLLEPADDKIVLRHAS
jgi:flavorubredoxin